MKKEEKVSFAVWESEVLSCYQAKVLIMLNWF